MRLNSSNEPGPLVPRCNHVRPHEAIAFNRPLDVHLGMADPTIPNFPETETLPKT